MFQENQSRVMAFRPLLFIFISISTLLICVYFLLKTEFFGFAIMLSLYIVTMLYTVHCKKYLICLIMLILSIFCSVYFVLNYYSFTQCAINENIQYTITGTFNEVSINTATGYSRILYNCTITDEANVVVQKGKNILLYIYGSNFECGDKITFKTKLNNTQYFSSKGLTNYAYKHIPYIASISSNMAVVEKTNLTIKQQVKLKAINTLKTYMSEEGASLSYAVVFGDKCYLDFDTKEAFIESGIAHILAVSGLHTGIIFALLIFAFKRVRIKYGYKLSIITVFLLMFAYLCDFTPSVVRACIMAIVLALTQLRTTKYDAISALALAGIIIVLISPIQLFNVSFVLSFSCIFSMALWSTYINRKTEFITNYGFSSMLNASIVTSIGTLPCMAFYFGNFSFLGTFLNVIILPIFTLSYVFLFLTVVLCLILPLWFALIGLDYVMVALIELSKYFTLIDYDYIRILNLGVIGLVLSFVLFYICSQKTNISKKLKIVFSSVLICIITISAILTSTPNIKQNTLISVEKANSSILYCNNQVTVFEMFNTSTTFVNTREYLREHNIYDIENLFIFGYEFTNINRIESFASEFNIHTIYVAPYIKDRISYYLENSFNAETIEILSDGEEYANNQFNFIYTQITQNSCMVNIEYDGNSEKVYSANAYV